jgi:TolA-binding protein
MRVIRHTGLLLLLFLALGIAVPPSHAGQGDTSLTLFVSVRENSGIPLSTSAIVRLSPVAGGQSMVNATKDTATAVFDSVKPGDYEIVVEAAGYDSVTERVTVVGVSTFTAYIYLFPAGSANRGNKPAGGMVMTPDLQRELDKGLQMMREKKYEEAKKHLEKARKLAPTNPDVLYLLGMVAYLTKDVPTARKQFETVLESYPAHGRSLVMLGQIELDVRENQEAAATLQKAIEAVPIDWQAHYLLALAYARTKEFEKARIEADRTVALKKEKKPAVELLKAKLLLMQQRNDEAQATLEALVKEFPGDPSSAEAQQYLAKLAEWRSSQAAKMESVAASIPQAVASEREIAMRTAAPPERSWAPADVDAGVPPTAPNVACSTEEVVLQTQRKISKQLSDLEKFGAVEHIEHQAIDGNGVAEAPVSQDFNYLIFVHHSAELPYYFDEMRNGAESLYQFPSALATRGLVSLGFMVLHPVFYRDFIFTCEGLGTWNGRPAWQIHFVQRNDVPSRIRSWSYKKVTYPVPLKGRIWIAANSYNLLHLDTALREPVGGLRLEREQLSVDYGPVKFRSGEINLWLPWYAEMYFDLQGKRYHHRHTLTNYVLFNVDSENKVSAPAGAKTLPVN